jgi:hypothetical protein
MSGGVKILPLAWDGMPKTSFRKNNNSPSKAGWPSWASGALLQVEPVISDIPRYFVDIFHSTPTLLIRFFKLTGYNLLNS